MKAPWTRTDHAFTDPNAVGGFWAPRPTEVGSPGRRRGILQPVSGLRVEWVDGGVSFGLGRGAYATVVMREVMKAPLDAY